MKLTFILPNINLSGGVRVVATLAARLRHRGHDVLVVSPAPAPVSLRQRLRHIRNGGGWRHPHAFQFDHFEKLHIPVKVLERYRPVAPDDLPDADAVIATWWETAEWVHALPPAKGAHAYFIQHDESTFPNQPAQRVINTWSLPMHKITIARWLVDLAARRAPGQEITLVPNSVDHAQFHAPPRGKQSAPTVGLLYHPSPFKGVDVALKAFALAKAQLPDLKLVSFGAINPAPFLPLPPDTDFTRLPPQDRIRDIYARCDLWICASHSEGFGLPILEAMACRCPAISTRCGGPQDIIKQGVNGYLVDVGDVASLADHVVEVLSLDPTRWRAFSDAAYQTAIGYTWDDAAALFESALQRAVKLIPNRASGR